MTTKRWITLALSLFAFTRMTSADIKEMGDKVQLAIPTVALTSTLLLGDFQGTKQLVKSFAASQLTTEALKRITRKERPNHSDRLSFPSGHTSASFQSASFLHFRYGFKYAIPAYMAAAFVGYSRIHAKRHDIVDVTAGAALGVFSSWYFTSRKEKPAIQPVPLADGVAIRYSASW